MKKIIKDSTQHTQKSEKMKAGHKFVSDLLSDMKNFFKMCPRIHVAFLRDDF